MSLLRPDALAALGAELLRSWPVYCVLVPVWLLLFGLSLGPPADPRSRLRQTMRLNLGHWVPTQVLVGFSALVYAEDVRFKFFAICANLCSLSVLQALELADPLLFRSSRFPALEGVGRLKFLAFSVYELFAHLLVAYGFVVLYNALEMFAIPLQAEAFACLAAFCPAVFYASAGLLLFANRLWYGHSAEEEAPSLRPLEREYARLKRDHELQQERLRRLQLRRARELNGFSWG